MVMIVIRKDAKSDKHSVLLETAIRESSASDKSIMLARLIDILLDRGLITGDEVLNILGDDWEEV
jgi:hypothetical protein